MLEETGVKGWKRKKKHQLTACHRKAQGQWLKDILRGQSRFLIHMNGDRVYVRNITREELEEHCVQPAEPRRHINFVSIP
jgi:hypothetical protein